MRVTHILIAGLLSLAATLSADDSSRRPHIQFVTCPDTLIVEAQETTSYQFELTPPQGRKPQNSPYYFLVSGPGGIDSTTGLWSLVANPSAALNAAEIVVGGCYTHNPHRDTAYCRFTVSVTDRSFPLILGDCPRYAGTVKSGGYIDIEMKGLSHCGSPTWSVVEPADTSIHVWIYYDGTLVLAGSKLGTHVAQVVLQDSCGADTCDISFTITDENPYGISIAQVRGQLQGQYASVDVSLDRQLARATVYGFELMLTYDNTALALVEVLKGEIYGECEWEYFTYDIGPFADCPECPTGIVRVRGMSDVSNGDKHPLCDTPDSLPSSLFTLKFVVSNDRWIECHYLPIRFFWSGCEDNHLFANPFHQLYADRVFDSVSASEPIDSLAGGFPGTNGPPYHGCYTYGWDLPLPFVDFYHGGIDVVCADSSDYRGDVNLNSFAFEIADAILFSRYLIDGPAVFAIDPAEQIQATDINLDNVPGTIEDYVLMCRIVNGQEWSSAPSGDTVDFSLTSNGYLHAQTPDTLGALYLEVAGNIKPYSLVPIMPLQYAFDGSVTHILLSPNLIDPIITSYLTEGDILGGLNGAVILDISTATYHGGKIASQIVDTDSAASYTVRIQKNHLAPFYGPLSANIYLDHSDSSLGVSGFDLLIEYEATALVFDSASTGELYQNYNWEYFNYRLDSAFTCDTCSGRLVHIVGIADINNGAIHPVETPATDTITMAALHFTASNDPCLQCAYLPLRFYWRGCGDNTVVSRDGSILSIAREVYDFTYPWLPDPIPPQYATFPGYAGVPEGACGDTLPGGFPILRNIDFFDGGFDMICADSVDSRGDINLNGWSFEPADALLFSRYLLYGDSVFHINPAGQKQVSNINGDQLLLTLEDYVLMLRASLGLNVYGCGYTYPEPSQKTSWFAFADRALLVGTEDSLSAILVILSGNVSVTNTSPLQIQTFFDGTNTRVILDATINENQLQFVTGSEQLFEWTPSARLVSITAATVSGAAALVATEPLVSVEESEDPLPRSFTLRQNYPNPFNAGTIISFDLPRASEVDIEIINVLGGVVYRQKGDFGAGTHRIFWKGTTSAGTPVASGIYYYRLTAGDFVAARKMLILK